MSALGRVVRSGMARRRVQTLVIGLATMPAVTASVLGGALLVSSEAPFEKAFDRQHGAQLTAQFDARRATAGQLAGSARAFGVAAASGPFPTATITPGSGAHSGAPLSVVGRSTSGGEIDEVAVTSGRWARKPGEIVVSADTGPAVRLGRELDFPDLPGGPKLKVVGVARSVSRTADAWVVPSQIAELTPSGRIGGYQMLYRFTQAGTSAQVARDRAAVTSAVPAKSLTGAQSWLAVRKAAMRETSLFVPFLVAFGVLGLVMSVLIVGNAVAGAVATGMRRLGVLKAVGCAPGQVVRACAGQALVPAAVGAGLGTVAGRRSPVGCSPYRCCPRPRTPTARPGSASSCGSMSRWSAGCWAWSPTSTTHGNWSCSGSPAPPSPSSAHCCRPAGRRASARRPLSAPSGSGRAPLSQPCVRCAGSPVRRRPGDPHPAFRGRLTRTRTSRASDSRPPRPACCVNCTRCTGR